MNTTLLNPFKELREAHSITLELMAKKIGITKQALIRLEQGTYVDPLPAAAQYCSSAFPVTEFELINQYAQYQTAKRNMHTRYFGDLIPKLELTLVSDIHPMRALRGSVNPTQVAKDLCIPQATLTYFERNVVQQKSVPKVVLNVLYEIGYTDKEITAFMEAYATYRKHVIRSRADAGKRVTYGYVSTRARPA
jgi:DNA-binding XRE family transcriptional regulator